MARVEPGKIRTDVTYRHRCECIIVRLYFRCLRCLLVTVAPAVPAKRLRTMPSTTDSHWWSICVALAVAMTVSMRTEARGSCGDYVIVGSGADSGHTNAQVSRTAAGMDGSFASGSKQQPSPCNGPWCTGKTNPATTAVLTNTKSLRWECLLASELTPALEVRNGLPALSKFLPEPPSSRIERPPRGTASL